MSPIFVISFLAVTIGSSHANDFRNFANTPILLEMEESADTPVLHSPYTQLYPQPILPSKYLEPPFFSSHLNNPQPGQTPSEYDPLPILIYTPPIAKDKLLKKKTVPKKYKKLNKYNKIRIPSPKQYKPSPIYTGFTPLISITTNTPIQYEEPKDVASIVNLLRIKNQGLAEIKKNEEANNRHILNNGTQREDKEGEIYSKELEGSESFVEEQNFGQLNGFGGGNGGGQNDRLAFHMHGHNGPHSYKWGFDTGKGKGHERQFRYEERDNEGHLKGHYGFYDKHGKLKVVNYEADPKTGFHVHPETER